MPTVDALVRALRALRGLSAPAAPRPPALAELIAMEVDIAAAAAKL